MRLIDADAIRENMYHEAFETDTNLQKWDGGCWIRYKLFENVIEHLPAADVIERNTLQHTQCVESVKNALDVPERNVGKWEIIDEVEPRRYGCSNCKRMVWHIENFCPTCGAKMEG